MISIYQPVSPGTYYWEKVTEVSTTQTLLPADY